MEIGKVELTRIIDIIPKDDQRMEVILHKIKAIALLRAKVNDSLQKIDEKIDEIVKELFE